MDKISKKYTGDYLVAVFQKPDKSYYATGILDIGKFIKEGEMREKYGDKYIK